MAVKGQSTKKLMQKERLQEKLLATYRKQQKWFQWGIIVLIALVLLLLLLLGYATDWFQGISKDALKSLPTSSETVVPTSSTTQNGADQTPNPNTGSNSNNTTTNNSATTNTNSSTTTPSKGLMTLYLDSNAGGSIDNVISQANSLGLTPICEDGLLGLRTCRFVQNGQEVVIRSLNGIVTSVLKNF